MADGEAVRAAAAAAAAAADGFGHARSPRMHHACKAPLPPMTCLHLLGPWALLTCGLFRMRSLKSGNDDNGDGGRPSSNTRSTTRASFSPTSKAARSLGRSPPALIVRSPFWQTQKNTHKRRVLRIALLLPRSVSLSLSPSVSVCRTDTMALVRVREIHASHARSARPPNGEWDDMAT